MDSSKGGAPKGNTNAAKGMEWRQAIKRALAKKTKKDVRAGLDEVAEQLVMAACEGQQWAIKEIGDRFDGKPGQSVELTGEDGGPVGIEAVVRFIKAN